MREIFICVSCSFYLNLLGTGFVLTVFLFYARMCTARVLIYMFLLLFPLYAVILMLVELYF